MVNGDRVAKPAPPGEPPLCECHGEAKKWHEDSRRKAGGYWWCPLRMRETARAYREANREKIAAMKRARYEANRDEIIAKQRTYREANRDRYYAHREANRDEIAAKQHAYYEANREKIIERQLAYYEANREKIAAKQRAYREANRENIRERANARYESGYREKALARWHKADGGYIQRRRRQLQAQRAKALDKLDQLQQGESRVA